ncbi:NAD(P)-binding domain-containing protein [Saccharibacillus endophyticus]|uniref:Flavoprotein n=1 Tax=Saccharibacillus endophyticus TaxID=2060666 RepID=A0ABQ1ZPI4_9BACL|nr:NAD(P)-binding domain-containing protein [Saccharibacillus endophyticus]GGH70215.1 flavoprotein [Saccharibacillus endophyticus]
MKNEQLPVAIIGAGPIGLAAAAQLVKQNQAFILFEAGASVGTNFLDYSHVRLFSSWEYNIDSAARSLLLKNQVPLPDPNKLPYGGEIVSEYLEPLSSLSELKPYIHLNSKVVHISRKGIDKVKTDGRELLPFIIQVENKDLDLQQFEAKAVIDATGTWHNPNPFISGGLNTMNQKNDSIHPGIPNILGDDKETFINKRVLVIGSGHSALNSILDLVKLKKVAPETTISWIIRKPNVIDVLGGGSNDQLPERGALGTRVEKEISNGNVEVHVSTFVESFKTDKTGAYLLTVSKNENQTEIGPFDHIISNTGSSPTFEFLKEIRYTFDSTLESVPKLAPLIDPNVHSCGTVRPHGEKELRQPEKDFYIVGAKSYGRAPTFLMATGYEQVRSIVAYLSGDREAAKRVELKLPETGVCKVSSLSNKIQSNVGSCCN